MTETYLDKYMGHLMLCIKDGDTLVKLGKNKLQLILDNLDAITEIVNFDKLQVLLNNLDDIREFVDNFDYYQMKSIEERLDKDSEEAKNLKNLPVENIKQIAKDEWKNQKKAAYGWNSDTEF